MDLCNRWKSNAARASGINVNKILIIVYSLCGFLPGIGALILAGRTDSGYPNAGLQSELDAIAACIIAVSYTHLTLPTIE